MGLFEKKVPVFRKRDRETWEKIRNVLDDAGIPYRSGHYEQENIPVGGYSAMDPRNFGKGGRIDREIYFINVKESLEESARAAIRSGGLVGGVETVEELTRDAAQKIKGRRY